MLKTKRWWVALCLQGLVLGAAAQGAYVAGSVGRPSWDTVGGGQSEPEHGMGAWRLAAGYRFNRIVAIEAFHFDFGRARSTGSLDGELAGTATGVQTLVGWQFGDADIAGKIGMARVRSVFHPRVKTATSEYALHSEPIAGLVGAYRLGQNLSIRLDVDLVTLALNGDFIFFSRGADVTTVSLGVMFRF